jgi:hypothetical protein
MIINGYISSVKYNAFIYNYFMTKTMKKTTKKSKTHKSVKKTITPVKKPITPVKKTVKRKILKHKTPTNTIFPTFVSTEGEDDLEASISFLLELMGSSLYETYVEGILNEESKQNINVVNVPHPSIPNKSVMIPGKPKIFYGSSKGTHFTCTLDGKSIWNSYNERIQINNTDHFCQTFTLMRMEYEFLPESFIGKEYKNLKEFEYLDNVMIAIKVACHVIEILQKRFNINSQVDEFLQLKDNMGNQQHIINPKLKKLKTTEKIIKNLISYCRSITEEQIEKSTFKQKIFLL